MTTSRPAGRRIPRRAVAPFVLVALAGCTGPPPATGPATPPAFQTQATPKHVFPVVGQILDRQEVVHLRGLARVVPDGPVDPKLGGPRRFHVELLSARGVGEKSKALYHYRPSAGAPLSLTPQPGVKRYEFTQTLRLQAGSGPSTQAAPVICIKIIITIDPFTITIIIGPLACAIA